MSDADLELTLHHWLETDASGFLAHAHLRERVIAIPAVQPAPSRRWLPLTGWSPVSFSATAAAAALAAIMASTWLGLFGPPAGADGQPCNARQMNEAIGRLRDIDGYRYIEREQRYTFDPSAELSIDDPTYAWLDDQVAEGAYRAPDRRRERMTMSAFGGVPGETIRADGSTWVWVAEEATWVQVVDAEPPNVAYGWIEASGGLIALRSPFDAGITVPDGLPGERGCTGGLSLEPGPDGVPRVLALRVDVAATEPTGIYIGPPDDEELRRNSRRTLIEIILETPGPDEIEPPASFVPLASEAPDAGPPEAQPTAGAPATATPLTPTDTAAWPFAPIELDLPAGTSPNLTAIAAGAGRIVAVGDVLPCCAETAEEYAELARAVVVTSTDGQAWSEVDPPPGFAQLGFQGVTWDGDRFWATGYRVPDPEVGTIGPELWYSPDGLEWALSGAFEPGTQVGSPVRASSGWAAVGFVEEYDGVNPSRTRPAVFASRDGSEWTSTVPPEAGVGYMFGLSVLDGGDLVAAACESPDDAPASSDYRPCIATRIWRSEDGLSWTPGPVQHIELWDMAATRRAFVGVGLDPATGLGMLVRSPDGASWVDVHPPDGGIMDVASVHVVGEELIVLGQPGGTQFWRSKDGESWEAIPLGVPPGAGAWAAAGGPDGLILLGATREGDGSVPVVWIEP